jgi:hypothetical protein
MRIIALIGLASLLVGCAARNQGTADRPSAPPASANTAAVAATATAPPSAVGTATPATASGDQAEAIDPSIVKRGYKPRKLNGQLKYCRSETLTGTHFSNTVCLTAAQIKVAEQNTQNTVDSMNRAGRAACPTKDGCN